MIIECLKLILGLMLLPFLIAGVVATVLLIFAVIMSPFIYCMSKVLEYLFE